MEFSITKGDYIELIQLLKVLSLASSGAEAKMFVDEGLVLLNNEVETRKRAKIRTGDVVEFEGTVINIL